VGRRGARSRPAYDNDSCILGPFRCRDASRPALVIRGGGGEGLANCVSLTKNRQVIVNGCWRAAEIKGVLSEPTDMRPDVRAERRHRLAYAHTGENAMRVHQQPIPCRLREATFVLDGLLEHETELDPRTVYTDTHGYTEVVMATAALPGKSLAPRIARMHEQTLYKLDP
jgi:Tn3 transposase DDE domain